MRIEQILQQTVQLASVSATARLDLELLLCHVLEKPRSFLFSHPEFELSKQQCDAFNALLQQRLAGHPVAHLTGTREFWSLELQVEPSTLIPRPDTETLVEVALELCDHSPKTALDLGTGTGAIALALASERPGWQVYGCDRVPEAVALARRNARHNNLERVQFCESHWFSQLPEHFSSSRLDLIVSNPPYICEHDPHLNQGDVRFEPSSALTAGADGLDDIRHICSHSPQWLNQGGWLLLEHGFDQGEAVRNTLTDNGFSEVSTRQDLAGHDRISLGRFSPQQATRSTPAP